MLDEERIPCERLGAPRRIVVRHAGEPGAQALVGQRVVDLIGQVLLQHVLLVLLRCAAMRRQRQHALAFEQRSGGCAAKEHEQRRQRAVARLVAEPAARPQRHLDAPLGAIIVTVGELGRQIVAAIAARVPTQRLRIHVHVECQRIGAIEQADVGGRRRFGSLKACRRYSRPEARAPGVSFASVEPRYARGNRSSIATACKSGGAMVAKIETSHAHSGARRTRLITLLRNGASICVLPVLRVV